MVDENVAVETFDTDASLRAVSRRRFGGLVAGGIIAAAAVLHSAPSAGARQAVGYYRTTADVNLRAGAGTTFAIVAVIPYNSLLTTTGAPQNGFLSTTYNGKPGWVSASFLTVSNGGSSDSPDPYQDFSRTARVSAATNFRYGATTQSSVISVLAGGTTVNIGTQVINGFRAVKYNGQLGWMIDTALVPGGGTTPPPGGGVASYINSPANFRMDPSYGNNVIRVLPAGTAVTNTGNVSGDFVQVTTPGDIGWVFKGLVTAGTAPGGNPAPNGPPTAATTTAALNLRASASTSAQILTVIPAGAAITIYGAAVNGFFQASWNGKTGYASASFIQTGTSGGGTTVSYRATAALNLRQQASATSALLGVVPSGAVFNGSPSSSNGYTSVTYRGVTGYVLSSFLVRA